jgi:hypothetical protein
LCAPSSTEVSGGGGPVAAAAPTMMKRATSFANEVAKSAAAAAVAPGFVDMGGIDGGASPDLLVISSDDAHGPRAPETFFRFESTKVELTNLIERNSTVRLHAAATGNTVRAAKSVDAVATAAGVDIVSGNAAKTIIRVPVVVQATTQVRCRSGSRMLFCWRAPRMIATVSRSVGSGSGRVRAATCGPQRGG